MLLALDTSTGYASIALVHADATGDATADATLAELNWQIGQRHSTDLLQRLDWLLRTHGVAPGQLACVAVATGPGSFNGVRVALAAAKSLAFALGVPLVGVPTLDCIGWGLHGAPAPIWAMLEAGRGQVYAARYPGKVSTPEGWAPADGYHVLAPAELAARIPATALFGGEWRAETRAALAGALGTRARFASPVGIRRAAWLAELALARAARGQYDDPKEIEPLYLRRPAITASTKVRAAPSDDIHVRRADNAPGGEGDMRALRR